MQDFLNKMSRHQFEGNWSFMNPSTLLEKYYAKEKEKSMDFEVFVQKETTVIKILTYNIMYHSNLKVSISL